MQTDALFYQVFQALPECYFELIGAPAAAAAGYTFASEELKQTGRRVDGVLLPSRPGKPVHFIEVFFYKKPGAYANLFGKIFLWLEAHDPGQDWHACLLFAGRRFEPQAEQPYRALLASDQVTRVYLDELPEPGADQLGLGILELIAAAPGQVVHKAKTWLARAQQAKKPVALQRRVIELIETAVLNHFPQLGRKELEDMLQMRDLRETRFYQETREEGLAEGLNKGLQKGREEGREEGRTEVALRLLTKGLPAAEVAEITGLPVQRVRSLKKKLGKA